MSAIFNGALNTIYLEIFVWLTRIDVRSNTELPRRLGTLTYKGSYKHYLLF